MVKKIAAFAGGTALLLSVALPALAWDNMWPWWSKDVAKVENGASAVSDTGGNSQTNYAKAEGFGNSSSVDGDGTRYMSTGNASSYAEAGVVANVHKGCNLCGGLFHKDYANVGNGALAGAYTGLNAQDDLALTSGIYNKAETDGDGARNMYTGQAHSTAKAWVLTNIHW